MLVFDYRPPALFLRNYVRLYQIIGYEFNDVKSAPSKPYWPRPENCLAFYPRDTEIVTSSNTNNSKTKPRSAIIGQPCFVTHRQVGHDFVLFQVVFQPGALFRLTGIPASELTNTFINAEDIFPSEIKLVNQRLSGTNDHLEMVDIVDNFICYLISRTKYELRPVDKISHYMLRNSGVVSLDWLAKEACLSRKQFYRKFVERMGISPKLYSRIIKLDTVIKLKNKQPDRDWFSIAIEMGYFDYQHLVKDFKEFTLLTPPAFYLLDSRAPERTFGHTET